MSLITELYLLPLCLSHLSRDYFSSVGRSLTVWFRATYIWADLSLSLLTVSLPLSTSLSVDHHAVDLQQLCDGFPRLPFTEMNTRWQRWPEIYSLLSFLSVVKHRDNRKQIYVQTSFFFFFFFFLLSVPVFVLVMCVHSLRLWISPHIPSSLYPRCEFISPTQQRR